VFIFAHVKFNLGEGAKMEITNIKINKVTSERPSGGKRKLLAYASVTFDNCFVVHNIALYDGEEGRKIVMPRRKTSKGEFKDVAHPTVNDFREFLTNSISDAYDNVV